jgi:hypothetical protein
MANKRESDSKTGDTSACANNWLITQSGGKIAWYKIDHTPSGLVKEDVLDKIWVKHWKYKSWITFKLLSLEMW